MGEVYNRDESAFLALVLFARSFAPARCGPEYNVALRIEKESVLLIVQARSGPGDYGRGETDGRVGMNKK